MKAILSKRFLYRPIFATLPRGFFSRPFSTAPLDEQELKIKIDVHFGSEFAKRYTVPSQTTVKEFAKTLMEENKEILGKTPLKYIIKDEIADEPEEISKHRLIDVLLKTNFKLQDQNNRVLSFAFDPFDAVAYHDNHPLDAALYNQQVPFQDAECIKAFTNHLINNLHKTSKGQAFQPKDIAQAIPEALRSLAVTVPGGKHENSDVVEELDKEADKEEQELQLTQKKITSLSMKIIRYGLVAMTIQWIVLFYLTYFAYGWDVTEPMGYLIALSLESYALYYFLKRRKPFDQSTLFKAAQLKHAPKLTRLRNAEIDVKMLRNKINYWEMKSKMF